MRIVVLRETWWAGVANENPLKPSWGASLGAVRTVFWLGGRKGSGKGGAFRKQIVFCDDFMTHFLSEFLYTVLSCATVVEVMAWASLALIFGFGGAQGGPFSAALETGFSGGFLQNKFFCLVTPPPPYCRCFGVWVHNQLTNLTSKRERKGKDRKWKNTREVVVASD